MRLIGGMGVGVRRSKIGVRRGKRGPGGSEPRRGQMQAALAVGQHLGGVEVVFLVGQVVFDEIALHVLVSEVVNRADFQDAIAGIGGDAHGFAFLGLTPANAAEPKLWLQLLKGALEGTKDGSLEGHGRSFTVHADTVQQLHSSMDLEKITNN